MGEIIGTTDIDLREHDIVLLAREERPVFLIDGQALSGIAKVIMDNREQLTVTVYWQEQISQNSFPFNDFDLLRRLFQKDLPKVSVRDMFLEKHQDELVGPDRGRSFKFKN